MDPPPKKQHLTWQFLMEVTQKGDLRWEADLAAHVSDNYLLLLDSTSCHMNYTRENYEMSTSPHIRLSQDISFSCPPKNLPLGIVSLDAL